VKKSETPYFEHVLLVDDEAIDNLINERLIQVHYFSKHVHVRNNIPAAIGFMKKAIENGNIPDVIFLDLHLPEHNGFVFLEEFKNMLQVHKELHNVSIVILSAYLQQHSHTLIDNYTFVRNRVIKPLREDVLRTLAEKIIYEGSEAKFQLVKDE
jgi:two-component SAPR family response regulator